MSATVNRIINKFTLLISSLSIRSPADFYRKAKTCCSGMSKRGKNDYTYLQSGWKRLKQHKPAEKPSTESWCFLRCFSRSCSLAVIMPLQITACFLKRVFVITRFVCLSRSWLAVKVIRNIWSWSIISIKSQHFLKPKQYRFVLKSSLYFDV